MERTNSIGVGGAVMAALLACTAGFAVLYGYRIEQVRAAIRAADLDLADLQRQLAVAARRSAAAATDRAYLRQVKAGLDAPAAAAPDASGAAAAAGPDWKALTKNPAFEEAIVAHYRAGLGLIYGDLYRQLGFSPEQVKRFEDALGARAQADYDVGLSALSMGLPWDDPSTRDLYKKNAADLAAGLQGLVTSQQLLDYDKAQVGRSVTSQLSATLASTADPLTPAQSSWLSQLVVSHAAGGGEGVAGAVDWDAVLAQAPGVLSPAQVAMLGAVRAKIQANGQMGRAYQEAMRAAGTRSP